MVLPLEKIVKRGNDPTGHGYYGAKRGVRRHRGLDLVTPPNSKIICPIDGFVTKIGRIYEATDKFKYIEITNDVYRTRLLYSNPIIKKGDRVFECEKIGKVQDIASYHNARMLNHLHWEIYKYGLLTDPEPIVDLLLNQIQVK